MNLVIELGAGRQEELIEDKVTFLRYICVLAGKLQYHYSQHPLLRRMFLYKSFLKDLSINYVFKVINFKYKIENLVSFPNTFLAKIFLYISVLCL